MSPDHTGELSDHQGACRYLQMTPWLFAEFLDHLSHTSRAVGHLSPSAVIRVELEPPLNPSGTMRVDLPSGTVWLSFHQHLDELAGRVGEGGSAHVRGLIKDGDVPVVVFRREYFVIFAIKAQVTC